MLRSLGAVFEPDVYKSVRSGECPVGLIPQENSIHGIVIEAYDILRVPDVGRDVFVRGEVTIGIQHCLITRKGVALRDVKRVLSHEQVRKNSTCVCMLPSVKTDSTPLCLFTLRGSVSAKYLMRKTLYLFWGCALSVSHIPSRGGNVGNPPPIYRSALAVLFVLLLGAWTMRSIHQESLERCGAREDALYGGSGGSPVERRKGRAFVGSYRLLRV